MLLFVQEVFCLTITTFFNIIGAKHVVQRVQRNGKVMIGWMHFLDAAVFAVSKMADNSEYNFITVQHKLSENFFFSCFKDEFADAYYSLGS